MNIFLFFKTTNWKSNTLPIPSSVNTTTTTPSLMIDNAPGLNGAGDSFKKSLLAFREPSDDGSSNGPYSEQRCLEIYKKLTQQAAILLKQFQRYSQDIQGDGPRPSPEARRSIIANVDQVVADFGSFLKNCAPWLTPKDVAAVKKTQELLKQGARAIRPQMNFEQLEAGLKNFSKILDGAFVVRELFDKLDIDFDFPIPGAF